MLAVRCIREQPLQHSTRTLSDMKQARTCRIVGSVVCVLIEPRRDHDHGLSTDENLNEYTKKEQECFIRLI